MNFLLGLLFGFLLGDRKSPGTGSGLPLPGGMPGGQIPNPFPFPLPGTTQTTPPAGNTPGNTPNTSFPGIMPGLLPGIIPASFPWGNVPPGQTASPGIPPVPPSPPVKTYNIKSGDYGSGLAKKATGDANRWKELLKVNPEMTTYTDSKGQTQIKPWAVGQKIIVPPGWNL